MVKCGYRAVSSAVEHLPYKEGVTGSKPVLPKFFLAPDAVLDTMNLAVITLILISAGVFSGCRSPIYKAAAEGNREAVTRSLKWGRSVDKKDQIDLSPLFHAARAGKLETVKQLLDLGADPNITSKYNNWRPLEGAIDHGHVEVARILIERGTDLNGPKERPGSALQHSIENGQWEIGRLLIDNGAEVSITDKREPVFTSFHKFVPKQIEFAQLLLQHGGDVNATDREGFMPIHVAIKGGNTEMVRFLLSHGADPDAPYKQKLPIELAKHLGHMDIVTVIQKEKERRRLTEEGKRAEMVAEKMRDMIETTVARIQPQSHDFAESTTIQPQYHLPKNPNDFAVVIGIEEYGQLPAARFAERDARAVREHLLALGVPQRNLAYLTGRQASRSAFVKHLEAWLSRNTNDQSTIYFYYSGHGAPEIKSGEAYLVPSDGDPAYLPETAYPMRRLYMKLNQLKAKRILVMVDACFSGAGGRSLLPEGARPLVTKVDSGESYAGRITALTAASDGEITGTHDSQNHGLFTYFLLRGLNGEAIDDSGGINAKSLYEYLRPHVQDEARRANREQSPGFLSGSNFRLR